MMLWIAIFVFLAGTLIAVFWPLLRKKSARTVLDHAILQHQEREGELARQYAAGLIVEQEYKAAHLEQARHLLALQARYEGKEAQTPSTLTIRQRKWAVALVLIGVPALALPLYLRLGQPNLPDRPLALRMAEVKPTSLNVEDALTKLEAHLLKTPGDGKGFEVIAPVYMRMERFVDAAHAYGRVVELLGETPDRLAAWGESLMAAAGGVITPEAQLAFERAVALDAGFAKAKFYLARLKEQNGDNAGAYQALTELAATLPPGAAQVRVSEEIARFHAEGKTPAGSKPPAAAEAISNLPSQEQAAMIRSMVDGLSARLAQKGGTAEEWLRLINARMVLGEKDAALAHLAEAKTLFKDDNTMLEHLNQLEQAISTTNLETKQNLETKP